MILKISILLPLICTLRALIECGHGFVGRPDLYLHEVCFRMTALRATTLHCRLVHVLPGLRASKHIIYFLSLQVHLLLEGLVDNEDIGTSFAVEAEIGCRLLGEQQVRAGWTEQHLLN